MKYTVKEPLSNFDFWSGAKDTVKFLFTEEINKLEDYLEDTFKKELPTKTDINDFFWFKDDEIAQVLGYKNFDELMEKRKDENNHNKR